MRLGHDPRLDPHDLAPVDPHLARLCEEWPSLPEHVILASLGRVDSGLRIGGGSPSTPAPRISCSGARRLSPNMPARGGPERVELNRAAVLNFSVKSNP